jgi:hypothetical protein
VRRRKVLTVAGAALLWPIVGEAQQAAKIPRIGYLGTDLPATSREAFLQGLRSLGYVEGRDVVIEYRYGEGQNFEQLPALAAEMVALKVDVIVAIAGTLAALAAQQATGTIPVVFIAVGDPVTSGLVSSLARPGGNITGLSALVPELFGKWLEILKQATPGVSRVALLRQSGGMGEHTDQLVLTEAADAARTLGVQLQVIEPRSPADLNRSVVGHSSSFMSARGWTGAGPQRRSRRTVNAATGQETSTRRPSCSPCPACPPGGRFPARQYGQSTKSPGIRAVTLTSCCGTRRVSSAETACPVVEEMRPQNARELRPQRRGLAGNSAGSCGNMHRHR